MRIGTIYHITPKSDWDQQKASSFYTAPTLKTEGFIHCSDVTLITRVANLFFRNANDLVLLEIDTSKIAKDLKLEGPVPRSEDWHPLEVFPHIYAPIPTNAVSDVIPFDPETDGTFRLPKEVIEKQKLEISDRLRAETSCLI